MTEKQREEIAEISKDFKKATKDYINMAIESNPNVADYYYFKSSLYINAEDILPILKKAIETDKSHGKAYTDALEYYDYYSAKLSLNLNGINKFISNYPNSKYLAEAKLVKKYIEDLAYLDKLLASKQIVEANAMNQNLKNNPLYKSKIVTVFIY